MLERLLAGQNQIAKDIADIKQSFNSRFEELETRVTSLELSISTNGSKPLCEKLSSEVASLKQSLARLETKNEDLESHSRRNNILIHGLPEDPNEKSDTLLSEVSKLLTESLEIPCPHIERCHRIGKPRDGRPRPVIMKILDFTEKVLVMKNASKLKGSDYHITEDFSLRVRNIRKNLFSATLPFRKNGSTVKIRYDHVYIDGKRYVWDEHLKSIREDRSSSVNMTGASAVASSSSR